MFKDNGNLPEVAAQTGESHKAGLDAFTQPQGVGREEPGHPEVCNIYSLHKIFSGAEATSTVYNECTTATRGCVDCKRDLADSINDYLKDLRERREDIKARPGYVQEILHEGGKKARDIAKETIAEVYDKMGLG